MESGPEVTPKGYILLSVLGGDRERIPIYSQPYTIGRAKVCDYNIPNKIVSGQHCRLSLDGETFYLEDTSTNGMLINKKLRTSKGKKFPLTNGDEVFLVYRKQTSGKTDIISFILEKVPEKPEADNNNEGDDLTLEYSTLMEGDTKPEDEDKKRKRDDDQTPAMQQSKRPHTVSSAADAITTISSDEPDSDETRTDVTGSGVNVVKSAGTLPAVVTKSTGGHGGSAMDHTSAERGAAGSLGVNNAPKVGITGKVASSAGKVDEASAGKSDAAPANTEDEDESQDEMMETLICSICQDILHDCISLQPCLHTFCAACYSQWMHKSSRCPSCRKRVKRISKNHIVNNLAAAYLKTHPDKRRSQEEIDEMNARNKITSDTVVPPKPDYEEYSDDSEDDELNSSADLDSPSPFAMNYPAPFMRVLGNIILPPPAPPMIWSCRQCPSYKKPLCPLPNTTGTTSTTPGTSSSSTSQARPSPPPYICPPTASHLMCKCCQERFPDRRLQPGHENLPPVQCTMCKMFYCHMYWGCTSVRQTGGSCLGCLEKLKDLNFGDKCLDLLVMGNVHESSILKNYLQQKSLTWRDVLSECLAKHGSGEFQSRVMVPNNTTSDSVVCYSCGLKVFRDLAFQYRKNIPRNQLPAEVVDRPDCHWGHNCRTQFNKPSHAARFNHICDQTRFA